VLAVHEERLPEDHPVWTAFFDLRGGMLSVRGPNVCAGFWTSRGFGWLDPGRWHDTGDLVEDRGGSLSFVGRADDRFKLENGRLIDHHVVFY